jgi:hypothetical protein
MIRKRGRYIVGGLGRTRGCSSGDIWELFDGRVRFGDGALLAARGHKAPARTGITLSQRIGLAPSIDAYCQGAFGRAVRWWEIQVRDCRRHQERRHEKNAETNCELSPDVAEFALGRATRIIHRQPAPLMLSRILTPIDPMP